ncbi:hypothetical protein B0T16DRAFT_451720 [Cercophora newfieldiana]|uniref:Uncharacterized protein n=1 Tax=Cercophora newfieldiana TaxID=92897 RepID=A0AA39YP73_9PEZI|nr:hypothetical protein B0T16DRAFT_451720 [Cercophora newfieldiana]
MGNICGKESDAFAQPGRRLGTTPETPASVPVPASATSPKAKVGGPPRRLGGDSSADTSGSSPDEARRKAALAAEARAQGNKGGDLGKKLADQRKLTHRATLEEASRKNLREREVDAVTETLRAS